MKRHDFSRRVGFLVNEVAHLYTRHFDKHSRERLGLSHAQCRLIGVVASNEGCPLKQADLARRLDLSPMGVTTLCDRMEAAGWIRRTHSATDRRANSVQLEPPALAGLEAVLVLSDEIQGHALSGFSTTEREQLISMLQRVHINLKSSQ